MRRLGFEGVGFRGFQGLRNLGNLPALGFSLELFKD